MARGHRLWARCTSFAWPGARTARVQFQYLPKRAAGRAKLERVGASSWANDNENNQHNRLIDPPRRLRINSTAGGRESSAIRRARFAQISTRGGAFHTKIVRGLEQQTRRRVSAGASRIEELDARGANWARALGGPAGIPALRNLDFFAALQANSRRLARAARKNKGKSWCRPKLSSLLIRQEEPRPRASSFPASSKRAHPTNAQLPRSEPIWPSSSSSSSPLPPPL